MQVETAFIVYRGPDGHWLANSDLHAQVVPQREATPDDFYTAAAVIQRDVSSQQVAMTIMAAQQQLALQMARQQQAQQTLANLEANKLRVPGV